MSRDYTSEVGIHSTKKTFPRPVAILILIVVAVGVSFGIKGVLSEAKEHKAAENAQNAAANTSTAPVAAGTPAAK